MFDVNMFAKFGIYIGAAAFGLISNGVSAQGVKVDFNKNLIGGFVRTASAEPVIFGDPDCSVASRLFCSGPAVAAVALEFPNEGSTMLRDLASNLVASAPFLRLKVSPDTATANLRVSVPTQIEADLDEGFATAGINEPQGFDLTIPVNVSGTTFVQPAMTAGLREDEKAPIFKFQKSYAFLK